MVYHHKFIITLYTVAMYLGQGNVNLAPREQFYEYKTLVRTFTLYVNVLLLKLMIVFPFSSSNSSPVQTTTSTHEIHRGYFK